MQLARRLKLTFGMITLIIAPFLAAQDGVRVELLKGDAVTPYIKDITELSLIIYKEYPYLYEGTEEEYRPFIEHYASSQNGIACLLFDNEKPVGVAIGMPMNEMREKYQQPLLNVNPKIDFDSLFYLGEFLLLQEYRGQGFGKEMYLELEQAVRKEGYFEKICFCKIEEFDQHPLKPNNYKPLDKFWKKFGFKQCENLNFTVFWRDVFENEDSPHQMIYYMKRLSDQ